jgi:rubrerythrin
MRVRARHQETGSHRRGGKLLRKPAAPRREDADADAAEEPEAPVPEAPGDQLADEWRMRAAGGPADRAQYACVCGYVFQADVSTSVACPNCGAAQAW